MEKPGNEPGQFVDHCIRKVDRAKGVDSRSIEMSDRPPLCKFCWETDLIKHRHARHARVIFLLGGGDIVVLMEYYVS